MAGAGTLRGRRLEQLTDNKIRKVGAVERPDHQIQHRPRRHRLLSQPHRGGALRQHRSDRLLRQTRQPRRRVDRSGMRSARREGGHRGHAGTGATADEYAAQPHRRQTAPTRTDQDLRRRGTAAAARPDSLRGRILGPDLRRKQKREHPVRARRRPDPQHRARMPQGGHRGHDPMVREARRPHAQRPRRRRPGRRRGRHRDPVPAFRKP